MFGTADREKPVNERNVSEEGYTFRRWLLLWLMFFFVGVMSAYSDLSQGARKFIVGNSSMIGAK